MGILCEEFLGQILVLQVGVQVSPRHRFSMRLRALGLGASAARIEDLLVLFRRKSDSVGAPFRLAYDWGCTSLIGGDGRAILDELTDDEEKK